MSELYAYAVVRGASGSLGRGLAREPLCVLTVGRLEVAVGRLARPPAVGEAALRAQAAAVGRIASRVDALLPIRFGAWFDGEEALAGALGPQAAELEEALALVAGREQMTLRVLGEPAAATGAAARGGAGPGTRYLLDRARTDPTSLPEVEAVRRLLAPLVHAERATGPDPRAPVRGSLYHLIPRGQAAAYRRAVAAARALPSVPELRVSGPFPPYAFAPELA